MYGSELRYVYMIWYVEISTLYKDNVQ